MTDKSNSWCFTLNNYTDKEVEYFRQLSCSYMKFGKEVGASGTPHLQGFVIFKNQYRLSALKKLNDRVSWHCSNSKYLEQNENYCSKDMNDVFEIDNRTQGKRNDMAALTDLIKVKGKKGVIEEMPFMYVKFHSGIEKLCFALQEPRSFIPNITWLWGKTGVGKTRYIYDNHDAKNIWISGKDLQWWDGYENQEVALIDDFRKDFCKFHELLRIFDRYPYNVAVKGGFRHLNSKFMYITSPYSPSETYTGRTEEDINQLLRRITKVVELV